MLIITAPSKTLDIDSSYKLSLEPTKPLYLKEAKHLRDIISRYTEEDLAKILNINTKLANLNFGRYQDWQLDHDEPYSRPAIHCYRGDIYKEMSPIGYSSNQQEYAQRTIRILSGLYGVLRPYDLIQPYRLEMKQKLEDLSLIEYWQANVTKAFADWLKEDQHKIILDLSSAEYSAAIDFSKLECRVVKVDFLDTKPDGSQKIVAIYAKKARGLMMEYCIINQIDNVDDLRKFNLAGYKFSHATESKLVFIR